MRQFNQDDPWRRNQPNQDALLQQLGPDPTAPTPPMAPPPPFQNGRAARASDYQDALAPDAASAAAWRANPNNPLGGMASALTGPANIAAGSTPGFDVGEPPPGSSTPSSTAATAKPRVGQYALGGFDQGKLQGDHDSPKYQIGRALSNFDPRQGLTPEVLAALNQLGLGTFGSDGRDGLTVTNGDPRFEGLTSWDAIQGYGGGAGSNPTWGFGTDGRRADGSWFDGAPIGGGAGPGPASVFAPPQASAAAPSVAAPGAPGMGGGMADPTSPDFASIQAEIAKLMQTNPNLAALLEQLGPSANPSQSRGVV